MLRIIVVLCVSFITVTAYIYIAPLKPIPDKFRDIEGCFVEELDKVISFNTTASKNCVEYRCRKEYVVTEGCSVIRATSPLCNITVDMEKLFPLCCAREECPPIET